MNAQVPRAQRAAATGVGPGDEERVGPADRAGETDQALELPWWPPRTEIATRLAYGVLGQRVPRLFSSGGEPRTSGTGPTTSLDRPRLAQPATLVTVAAVREAIPDDPGAAFWNKARPISRCAACIAPIATTPPAAQIRRAWDGYCASVPTSIVPGIFDANLHKPIDICSIDGN